MSFEMVPSAHSLPAGVGIRVEKAYNVRHETGSVFSIVDVVYGGKKIVAAALGEVPLGEENLDAVRQVLEEAKQSFHKNMWGNQLTGLYCETDAFRFLRSDPLDENGHMHYTGQGYVPKMLVQIKVGVSWYDLNVTVA